MLPAPGLLPDQDQDSVAARQTQIEAGAQVAQLRRDAQRVAGEDQGPWQLSVSLGDLLRSGAHGEDRPETGGSRAAARGREGPSWRAAMSGGVLPGRRSDWLPRASGVESYRKPGFSWGSRALPPSAPMLGTAGCMGYIRALRRNPRTMSSTTSHPATNRFASQHATGSPLLCLLLLARPLLP